MGQLQNRAALLRIYVTVPTHQTQSYIWTQRPHSWAHDQGKQKHGPHRAGHGSYLQRPGSRWLMQSNRFEANLSYIMNSTPRPRMEMSMAALLLTVKEQKRPELAPEC